MLREEEHWPQELIGLARKKWTLGGILAEKARRNKDKVFILFEDKRITFDYFNKEANRIANGLIASGIKKGIAKARYRPALKNITSLANAQIQGKRKIRNRLRLCLSDQTPKKTNPIKTE